MLWVRPQVSVRVGVKVRVKVRVRVRVRVGQVLLFCLLPLATGEEDNRYSCAIFDEIRRMLPSGGHRSVKIGTEGKGKGSCTLEHHEKVRVRKG